MTETAAHVNGHEPAVSSGPFQDLSEPVALPDATDPVRRFNAANRTHHDLWSRTRHAADIVDHAEEEVSQADAAEIEADISHRAIQAEHPDRRAPRVRQLALVVLTIALDAVACNFAAQALGDSQRQTLVWTALFLAVLAAGEVALHVYRERGKARAWQVTAGCLAAFVVMLGDLRFSFLSTVGIEGPITALVGAALFTAATAGFVVIGYRALRAAETAAAWKARRRKAACEREAQAARRRADLRIAERDRLADAYISEIRASLIQSCTASQLQAMEQAVRTHLLGRV